MGEFRQAHPDPRVRYLAHRDTQPVDSWERDLSLVLGSIAFLVLIAAVAVLLNPVAAWDLSLVLGSIAFLVLIAAVAVLLNPVRP